MKFGPMSEAITGPMRPVPIYVHIPKTGGTTYCTALMRSFHGGKRFSVMGLRNRNDQKIERLFRLTEKQLNRIGPSSTVRRDFLQRFGRHRTIQEMIQSGFNPKDLTTAALKARLGRE